MGPVRPSYSTLGPVVQYNSIAPQEEMGLFVSQSFGDFDMKRTFIRASTGRVGPFFQLLFQVVSVPLLGLVYH